MTQSYKALTYIHLPVVEKDFSPGDEITAEDLDAAEQTAESIQALVDGGALGGEGDEINPQNIVPSPSMPTIARVVADAKSLVAEMEGRGEEIPGELRAVAELDYTLVEAGDAGTAGDANA